MSSLLLLSFTQCWSLSFSGNGCVVEMKNGGLLAFLWAARIFSSSDPASRLSALSSRLNSPGHFSRSSTAMDTITFTLGAKIAAVSASSFSGSIAPMGVFSDVVAIAAAVAGGGTVVVP